MGSVVVLNVDETVAVRSGLHLKNPGRYSGRVFHLDDFLYGCMCRELALPERLKKCFVKEIIEFAIHEASVGSLGHGRENRAGRRRAGP